MNKVEFNLLNNESDKLKNKNVNFFIESSDSILHISSLNLNSNTNSFLNSNKSIENINFLKRNNSMKNLKTKKNDLSSKDELFANKFTFSQNILKKFDDNNSDLSYNNIYFIDSEDENEEEGLEILKILKNNIGIENNKN